MDTYRRISSVDAGLWLIEAEPMGERRPRCASNHFGRKTQAVVDFGLSDSSRFLSDASHVNLTRRLATRKRQSVALSPEPDGDSPPFPGSSIG